MTNFSIDLLKDAIGYAASIAVFITFWQKSVISLRFYGIVSNLLFIIYGWTIPIYPVLVLHGLLLPLNVFRLFCLGASPRLQPIIPGPKPDQRDSSLPKTPTDASPGSRRSVRRMTRGDRRAIAELMLELDMCERVAHFGTPKCDLDLVKRYYNLDFEEAILIGCIEDDRVTAVIEVQAIDPAYPLEVRAVRIDQTSKSERRELLSEAIASIRSAGYSQVVVSNPMLC